MENISLEEEEYIIASDKASVIKGLSPQNGTLMLTNVRLLFLSHSKWSAPFNLSIELDTIDLIDHKKWLQHSFHVHANDQKYRFLGNGGKRIYERLLLRRKALSIGNIQREENIQAFREIIYLQGDIQVFVAGQLTTDAQIFFTSKKLKIDAHHSFFRRHPPFETTLENITSFSYNLLKKSLDIHTHDRSISIMGPLIPKLYLLLIGHKEGGISQTWNAREVTFNRGILYIKGIASLSQKHFLFCPTDAVDSFAGAQVIKIPIQDIKKIDIRGWPERNITISYMYQTFSFSTPNIKRDFRSLSFHIVQFKPETPWKVNSKDELLAVNERWSLSLKDGMEKIILINWTAFELSEESFFVGWLMLTNLRVLFLSLDPTQKWSAQVLNIEAPSNQRSGINISYQNKNFFFICFGGVRFSNLFWNKIAMIKPPPEITSARSGQSLDKIIGPNRMVMIYKNNHPIHKLTSVKIIKRAQSILIQCDKIPATELSEGSIVEVEVPKEVGRFRFFTTAKEVRLVRPTPMGLYILSVALPDNIYVYNQRKAFRVPFQQEIQIDLIRTDKPTRCFLHDDFKVEKTIPAEIFDLSFEGVGILLPSSLQEESPETILIRFNLLLFGQNLQMQGTIRHIGYVTESEQWSHGIHFINLPPQTEQTIFQEVLKLERELLRSAEEDQ